LKGILESVNRRSKGSPVADVAHHGGEFRERHEHAGEKAEREENHPGDATGHGRVGGDAGDPQPDAQDGDGGGGACI
jgi:hypothetical protein